MEATPLHMATFLGHSEIGEELLKNPKTNVNAVDKVRVAKRLITGLQLSAYRTLPPPLPHKDRSNKNINKTPKTVPVKNSFIHSILFAISFPTQIHNTHYNYIIKVQYII